MDEFEDHSCDFKNESECEEELEEKSVSMEEAEADKFGGRR
jgi:hypothetical protein